MNTKALQTNGRRLAAPNVVPMRGRDAMVSTTEDISPATAARYLEKNVINRPISERMVTDYAHDMELGRWVLTEESIAFDREGNLVQGQHRLSAIVKSGKTIKLRVTRNAPDILSIRDRGRQRRVGDFLQWSDHTIVEGDTKRIVAWLGILQLMRDKAAARYRVSSCQDILEEHEPAVKWLTQTATSKVHAPICGALIFAYPGHESHCETFLDLYISGAGLEKGSPVLALRNRALRANQTLKKTGDKHWSERLEASYQTLTALKAFMKKKPLVHLYKSDEAYLWFKESRERKGLT